MAPASAFVSKFGHVNKPVCRPKTQLRLKMAITQPLPGQELTWRVGVAGVAGLAGYILGARLLHIDDLAAVWAAARFVLA